MALRRWQRGTHARNEDSENSPYREPQFIVHVSILYAFRQLSIFRGEIGLAIISHVVVERRVGRPADERHTLRQWSDSASSRLPLAQPERQHKRHRVNIIPENRVNIETLTSCRDSTVIRSYFLGRTTAPPFRKKTVVLTTVEDPEGSRTLRIGFHNYFPSSISRKSLLDRLPVGTIVAIKNPRFDSSDNALMCEDPEEVIIFDETSLREKFPDLQWKSDTVQTPNNDHGALPSRSPVTDSDWKALGDTYLKEKCYKEAIDAYTSGLKVNSQSIDLLLRRSSAYRQMSVFAPALTDVEDALKMNPRHLQANLDEAKTLCGLKRYTQALDFLNFSNTLRFPKSERCEIAKAIQEVKTFLAQQERGEFDIPFMIKAWKETRNMSFDFADYVGTVEVRTCLSDQKRGRGLFATEKIDRGQLVIGSKAFVMAFSDPNVAFNRIGLSDNNVSLVNSVLEMLEHNGQAIKEVYKLYAGPVLGFLEAENDDCALVDAERIENVCNLNSFSSGHGTGLWILPSFINHTCIDCNCAWTVYGDFMLVRAFKPIAKGEEILISYVAPDALYSERRERLEKHGFICRCRLCHLDRTEEDDVHLQRKHLLKEFADLVRERKDTLVETEEYEMTAGEEYFASLFDGTCSSSAIAICDPDAIQVYVEKLESLRPDNPQLNLPLIGPLYHLSLGLYGRGQVVESAQVLERVFLLLQGSAALGDQAVAVAVNIVSMYADAGKSSDVEEWIEKLKKAVMATYGTVSVLDILYHESFIEKLKDNRIVKKL